MNENNFVVLYGSMASLLNGNPRDIDARIPRDIDLAVDGRVSFADAEAIARPFIAAQLRKMAELAEVGAETRAAFGRAMMAMGPTIAAGEAARKRMTEIEEEASSEGRMVTEEYHEQAKAWLGGNDAQRRFDRLVTTAQWSSVLRDLAVKVEAGDIPVDVRRYHRSGSTLVLPRPSRAAATSSAIVLSGTVVVGWQAIDSIPAILRSGLPAAQMTDLIRGWVENVGGDFAHCHREFNLLPTLCVDLPYTTSGVTALRSARQHVSEAAWRSIVDALGDFGSILDWMLSHQPSDDVVQRVGPQTPDAAPGFVLCVDAKRQQLFTAYGDFSVSFADAPAVLSGV